MALDLAKTAALLRPVAGLRYLLRDLWRTAATPPLASPRACEPGPGALTLVQTDGALSIAGGELALTPQSTPAWTDLGFYSGALPRRAGATLLLDVRPQAGFWEVGWRNTGVVDTNFVEGLYLAATAISALTPFQVPLEYDLVADSRLQLAVALRAAGAYWWLKRQSSPVWELVWHDEGNSAATLYVGLASYNGQASLARLEAIDRLAAPRPLASDSFARNAGTSLGLTDGLAHLEQTGGAGLAWQEASGDLRIAGNRLLLQGAAPALPAAAIALVDVGTADVLLRATINVPAGEAEQSIVFRYVDSANFWLANVNTSAVTLREVVAGVDNTRATAAGVAAGARSLTVSVAGLRATVWVDGARLAQYEMPPAAGGQFATRHGLRLGGATAYAEDFLIHAHYQRISQRTRPRNLAPRPALVAGAPYEARTFVASVNLFSFATPREAFMDALSYRIRQTGLVRQVKLYVHTGGVESLVIRFWRETASGVYTWTQVAATEDLAAAVTPGTVSTVALATPVSVQEGDHYSVLFDANSTSRLSVLTDRGIPAQVYYTDSPPADGASGYAWRQKTMYNAQAVTFAGGTATATSHGLSTGDPVACTTTGALPSPLFPGTTAWARNLTANTFSLHPSAADATGNTNSYVFVGGSGAHAVGKLCNALQVEFDFDAPHFIAIGDSLTSGAPWHSAFASQSLPPYAAFDMAASYPYQLAALRGWSYQNMGVSGQNAAQVAARFTADVCDQKPAIAIILVGANDIGQAVTVASYLASVKQMLDACRLHTIVPVVIQPLPCNNHNDTKMSTLWEPYHAGLATLCRAYPDAILVDASALLGQERGSGPPGNRWDLSALYNVDGTHLSPAGYGVLAGAVAQAIG